MNLEELDVVLGGRSILNPREYNSLALAHIGDAVFEVLVRLTVLTDGNAPVNKLHKKARDIVNAKAQAEMYYRIQDILTEEEADVFRRGRNAKSFTVPKNADLMALCCMNETVKYRRGGVFLERENRREREWNENQLEGRNAVLEVLRSGRDIEKIMVQKGNVEGTIKRIVAQAAEKGVVIQEVSRQKLDELSQTKNHQGVIALVSAHDYVEVEDILAAARAKGEDPFIILLDGITDPHNLGAILRTAECAGAHGVIIPKRRSVGLNATVGKTSAGAIEYMPVAKVTNLVKTMEQLKKEGLWFACADMGENDHFDTNLKGPIGLVIGSEGEGVSRLVKENCDFTASIPMYGKISSLNASVAAALLMYEVVRQRNYSK